MYAMKMAPKLPAAPMLAAGCGVACLASLSTLGLSSADAKKAGGAELSAQIMDAAAHISAQKAAILDRV